MKAQFTKKLINSIQLAIFIFIPAVMVAAPLPPNPGNSTGGAPIDAGLGFLLVAGASYGIKRVVDARKQKS